MEKSNIEVDMPQELLDVGKKALIRAKGIKEINEALWIKDDYDCLIMKVHDERGIIISPWLKFRPSYCDRGHIQLVVDGPLSIDHNDSFPRYFFSFEEADMHTRLFLKWRLWKDGQHPRTWKGFE